MGQLEVYHSNGRPSNCFTNSIKSSHVLWKFCRAPLTVYLIFSNLRLHMILLMRCVWVGGAAFFQFSKINCRASKEENADALRWQEVVDMFSEVTPKMAIRGQGVTRFSNILENKSKKENQNRSNSGQPQNIWYKVAGSILHVTQGVTVCG